MLLLSDTEQELVSRLQLTPNHGFRNWSSTFSCRPLYYLSPRTELDIIALVRLARRHHLTIKPVGSGHSPSDIACTSAIMLNMDRLDRVLGYDSYACRMTLEAGMRLHSLHRALRQRGMALSCIGSISDQSIAGAIATATHGTGMAFGDMSSIVTELVVVDGWGQRRVCSRTQNKDLFDAARCSLGALGIITQVTVQCEPAFTLHALQTPESLDYVLDNLEAVAHSAEHVRVWWFPHTDHTVVWRANRTDLPPQPAPEQFVRDRLYGFHIYQMQLLKSRLLPNGLPALAEEHFGRRFNRQIEWVDDSERVFNFDCLFPQYVNEWAIPWQNTPSALRELRQWVDNVAREEGIPVHFPIEIRFVKESDVWMSPAYQRTVCYIGVIVYRPYGWDVPYGRYWRAYEDIMRTLDGRPHWAKAHQMYYFDLRQRYPMFDRFLEVRQECDPQNIFVNGYIRRHILPPPDAKL